MSRYPLGLGSRTPSRYQNLQMLKSLSWPFVSAGFNQPTDTEPEGWLYLESSSAETRFACKQLCLWWIGKQCEMPFNWNSQLLRGGSGNNTLKILGSLEMRDYQYISLILFPYCYNNWELPYLLLLFNKPIEYLEENNLPKCPRYYNSSL